MLTDYGSHSSFSTKIMLCTQIKPKKYLTACAHAAINCPTSPFSTALIFVNITILHYWKQHCCMSQESNRRRHWQDNLQVSLGLIRPRHPVKYTTRGYKLHSLFLNPKWTFRSTKDIPPTRTDSWCVVSCLYKNGPFYCYQYEIHKVLIDNL